MYHGKNKNNIVLLFFKKSKNFSLLRTQFDKYASLKLVIVLQIFNHPCTLLLVKYFLETLKASYHSSNHSRFLFFNLSNLSYTSNWVTNKTNVCKISFQFALQFEIICVFGRYFSGHSLRISPLPGAEHMVSSKMSPPQRRICQ